MKKSNGDDYNDNNKDNSDNNKDNSDNNNTRSDSSIFYIMDGIIDQLIKPRNFSLLCY